MTKAWKIYFYCMIAGMLVEYSTRFQFQLRHGRHISAHTMLELLFSIVLFIGLYGYIFRKKIFIRGFWAVFFLVLVIYQGWDSYQDYLFHQNLDRIFPTEPDVLKKITDILVEYVLPFPFFVGLFLYSFNSAAIWKNPENESELNA